jgi:Mrp family chromosome partitioning ATPase
MTEHSKIPTPPAEGGKSLFERADDLFALGGNRGAFRPAMVPEELDAPANPRARRTVRKAVFLEETVDDAENAAPQVPERPAPRREVDSAAPIAATPIAATKVAAAPLLAVERIEFTGERRIIDRDLLEDRALIVPGGKVTALMEEFRIVKRQLLLGARDAAAAGAGPAAQRILVCSPLPGEGKTFCATNLALAIAAERDTEVVLVDADFAKPSILSLLGLPTGPGLMDALARPDLAVEDCVIPTDIAGLYVLPAGNGSSADSEYLSSDRTRAVLDRLVRGAPNRIVIFDSPPALAASPAAELAKYAGQALVICRADQTGQSALEDALTLLSGCPDIKLLLNAANFSPSGRRFGAYYGYGG